MGSKPKRNRWRAVVIMTIALAVCCVVYLAFSLPEKAKRYALQRLTEAIQEQLEEPYRLTLEDMDVNLTGGAISFRRASITPDSALLEIMSSRGESPSILYDMGTGRVEVALKVPRKGNLRIKHIYIRKPYVRIVGDTVFRHGSDRLFRSRADGDTLSPGLPFRNISIGKIVVEQGDFSFTRVRREDTLVHAVAGVNIDVDDMALDSTFRFGQMRLPEVKSLRLSVRGGVNMPVGENYTLTARSISLSLKDGRLDVDTVAIVPRYGKSEFTARTFRDWTRFDAVRIDVWGLDIYALAHDRSLFADSLSLRGPKLESYKNRQMPVPAREKPLLHHLLQQLPVAVSIPRITISEGEARYEELPVKGIVKGVIYVKDIHARIDSLSNLPFATNYFFTLDATSRMMGSGLLNAKISLPVHRGDNDFIIHGTLHRMDLRAFNTMAEPLAKLRIDSGVASRIDFSIDGDDRTGIILMRMQYDSLKADVLDKTGMRSWLGSMLVNTIVIESSNPLPGKEVREVRTSANRDPYRSNLNYWWRIVFEATKESVGLTKSKQQQLSSLSEKLSNMKANRQQRKQQREQKRQQRGIE